jgi:hypothetical protein
MKDYLEILQNVSGSIEKVLNNTNSSSREKLVAERLRQSLQLCAEELIQSAIRLYDPLRDSLAILQTTDKAWKVKSETPHSPASNLLGIISKLSGSQVKASQNLERLKPQAIENLTSYWQEGIDSLCKEYFLDKDGSYKKGIGWKEKEGFIENLKLYQINFSRDSYEFIATDLQSTYSELTSGLDKADLNLRLQFIDLDSKIRYQGIIAILESRAAEEMWQKENTLSTYRATLQAKVACSLDAVINCSWGDLKWEDLSKANSEYKQKLVVFIEALYEKKINFTKVYFTKLLSIYNDFLTRDLNAQSETPEQREKAQLWLNQQREQLQCLYNSLEQILQSRYTK